MIGIVLLSQDGYYLDSKGNLPSRPDFDKQFLLGLIKDQVCIASPNTYKDLPKSVFDNAKQVVIYEGQINTVATVNLGIKTFKVFPPDLFFIVESDLPLYEGKKFDIKWLYSYYNEITEGRNLRIFKKNKTYDFK